jgi:polysaccharide pyruvyl transferase WcaK-like protein
MPLPNLPPNVDFVDSPRYIFRKIGYLINLFLRLIRIIIPIKKNKLTVITWKIVDKIQSILIPLFLLFPNKLLKTIKILRTSDIFYGVGAADFNDFNLEDIVYKTWLYKIANRYVKIVVISSQGIGPINNHWAKKKLKEAFDQIHVLSFRDCYFSKLTIDELQLKGTKYNIVGDEAFNLSIANKEQILSFLRDTGLPPNASFIAFHFRETDYTKKTSYLIPKIASILDEIIKIFSHYIIFFSMSYHTHSTYDEQCGRKIKSHLSFPEKFLIAPLCKDVHIIKGAVGLAVYSLGLSYHLHVFAVSQNRPALILYSGDYYRYKSEGLIRFYNDPCKALDIERCSKDDILKAIELIEKDYENTVDKIKAINKKICEINDWHINEMILMLSKS